MIIYNILSTLSLLSIDSCSSSFKLLIDSIISCSVKWFKNSEPLFKFLINSNGYNLKCCNLSFLIYLTWFGAISLIDLLNQDGIWIIFISCYWFY